MPDANIYLGRVGNLVSVYHPRGQFEATRQRQVHTFPLGNGGTRVDQMIGGARTYTIGYDGLTREAFAVLQAFADGHEGAGPFVLLDPGQRNMLPSNISGATSVTNDTVTSGSVGNFSVAGSGCSIASSTLYTDAGPRVVAWTFANASPGASATLGMAWPSTTFAYGIPVADRSLCFSCWVRGGGTDAIVTYTPQIRWKDATGAVVSTTSGSNVASSSGAWAQMFATASKPATAVYADFRVLYASGVSAGSIAYFRRFMVNEGSTPDTTWVPGTGVWPVKVTDLNESWTGRFPELRDSPAISFQEDTS